MKKSAVQLPNIEDDAAFAARLQPLASKILPGRSEIQASGISTKRITDDPDDRQSATPRQAVASRRDEIEAKRGPRKRYEYVLPARVGDALADEARKNGVSATLWLLQVLRNAGYPVIPEDLLDLRLERARK
jgi:hypothetical protein